MLIKKKKTLLMVSILAVLSSPVTSFASFFDGFKEADGSKQAETAKEEKLKYQEKRALITNDVELRNSNQSQSVAPNSYQSTKTEKSFEQLQAEAKAKALREKQEADRKALKAKQEVEINRVKKELERVKFAISNSNIDTLGQTKDSFIWQKETWKASYLSKLNKLRMDTQRAFEIKINKLNRTISVSSKQDELAKAIVDTGKLYMAIPDYFFKQLGYPTYYVSVSSSQFFTARKRLESALNKYIANYKNNENIFWENFVQENRNDVDALKAFVSKRKSERKAILSVAKQTKVAQTLHSWINYQKPVEHAEAEQRRKERELAKSKEIKAEMPVVKPKLVEEKVEKPIIKTETVVMAKVEVEQSASVEAKPQPKQLSDNGLDKLSKEAESQYKANRLTSPKGNSLVDTITEMKKLGHAVPAKYWGDKASQKYVGWIKSGVKKARKPSDLKDEKAKVWKIKLLSGNTKLLAEMKSLIAKKESALIAKASKPKPVKTVKVEPKAEPKVAEKQKSEVDKFTGEVKNFWGNITSGNVEVIKDDEDILGL